MTKFTIPEMFCGFTKFQQGTKRVIVRRVIKGNKAMYEVTYYDDEYNRIAHQQFGCCQPPTLASTVKGAERKINQFFNNK